MSWRTVTSFPIELLNPPPPLPKSPPKDQKAPDLLFAKGAQVTSICVVAVLAARKSREYRNLTPRYAVFYACKSRLKHRVRPSLSDKHALMFELTLKFSIALLQDIFLAGLSKRVSDIAQKK